MRTNKICRVFSTLIPALVISVLLVACGGSDPVSDYYEEEIGTPSSSTSNIEQTIKSNVSVNASYSEYYVNTTIKSTLSSALSGKTIQYGIEFGYDGDYAWHQSCENFSGTTGSIKSSIFFDCGKYKFSADELYVRSYLKIMDKKAKGESISSEEKDLFAKLVTYLNRDEPIAKKAYNGRVFVEVNGQRHYVKNISF